MPPAVLLKLKQQILIKFKDKLVVQAKKIEYVELESLKAKKWILCLGSDISEFLYPNFPRFSGSFTKISGTSQDFELIKPLSSPGASFYGKTGMVGAKNFIRIGGDSLDCGLIPEEILKKNPVQSGVRLRAKDRIPVVAELIKDQLYSMGAFYKNGYSLAPLASMYLVQKYLFPERKLNLLSASQLRLVKIMDCRL